MKKHCQELIRLLAMKVSGNKVLTYDDGSNHHGSEQFNEGSTGSNFVEDAVDEMYREDGLLVMARGLGIHRVASKFLEYYGDDRAKGRLVFCLNAVGGDENFLFEDWFEDDSESTALSSRRTKVIRSDVLQADRSRFYAAGGCFLISTQIILADLLQKKVDASRIAGFLVLNAHRVTESSNEAFVIRIFKQENKFGFVKAFSDAPETLASGFMKVDRLCKNLFVRRLFLYPRFKDTVEKCLDPLPPEVIEFIQPLMSSSLTVSRFSLTVIHSTELLVVRKLIRLPCAAVLGRDAQRRSVVSIQCLITSHGIGSIVHVSSHANGLTATLLV